MEFSGCVHLPASVHNAALNVGVHICVKSRLSLEEGCWSRVGERGMCVNFWRTALLFPMAATPFPFMPAHPGITVSHLLSSLLFSVFL